MAWQCAQSPASAFEIYSERGSEEGNVSVMTDWTLDDGSPRKKVSPRKKSGSPRKKAKMAMSGFDFNEDREERWKIEWRRSKKDLIMQQYELSVVVESTDPDIQELTLKRYAADSNAYSYNEFVEFYGNAEGERHWKLASREEPRKHSSGYAASTASNPAEQEHRTLCNVLWESRPMWKPKDLVSAEKKLRKLVSK